MRDVIDEASYERDEYHERVSRRRANTRSKIERTEKEMDQAPAKRRNMFEGLDISEEVSSPKKKIMIVGPKVVKPRAPQGCWANGCPNKGEVKEVVEEINWKSDPKLGAWGDESDNESDNESELGDWGDE